MPGHIPEEKVSEIIQAADIVEVISDSVQLKKSGRDFQGLCPFHAEKTPSFHVDHHKQLFYCFGCGEGGNVVSFVMKQENASFPEAIRMLASRYHILIPETRDPEKARQKKSEQEQYFEVNRMAMEFFRGCLHDQDTGKNARKYLEERGFSRETLAAFQVGFDPGRGESLFSYAQKKKIPKKSLEALGLIVNKNGRYYDRFWDRIVFPIFDPKGRVIGFGGRVMNDANPNRPKYLNSPETPLFDKSRSLYGLPTAKIPSRQSGEVFIVEGYLDILSLYQNGIKNAVATLGTSLTPEHIRLLLRYAESMILVYDSDEAGIRAAVRCIDNFRKIHIHFSPGSFSRDSEFNTRILVLPKDHDPDSFVRDHGGQAFEEIAKNAPGYLIFLMNTAIKKHGLSIEGKMRVIADMADALLDINDPVARALYTRKLSEKLEVDEASVYEKMRSFRKKISQKASSQDNAVNQARPSAFSSMNRQEKEIVSLMLACPGIVNDIKDQDVLSFFEDKQLKKIAQSILHLSQNREVTLETLLCHFTEDKGLCNLVSLLCAKNRFLNETPDQGACAWLLTQFIHTRKNKDRMRMKKAIEEAEKQNDMETVEELLREKQKQAKEKMKQIMALQNIR